MKKKLRFVTIKERCGEYEFDTHFVTKATDKQLDKILKNWRGEGSDPESDNQGGYYLCGGTIFVEIYKEEPTTEVEFEVLKKFLSEL